VWLEGRGVWWECGVCVGVYGRWCGGGEWKGTHTQDKKNEKKKEKKEKKKRKKLNK